MRLPQYPVSRLPPHLDKNGKSQVSREGIFTSVIQLSEAWRQALAFARNRNETESVPLWSPHSEYTHAMSSLMEISASTPQCHRYKHTNPSNRTGEELDANRSYWAPWFLSKFLHHTAGCLINHPAALVLHLYSSPKRPDIFLQQASSLLSKHTEWISHLIDIINAKSFRITDPLLAYCAAVAATIELYSEFSRTDSVRIEKRERYIKCLDFVRSFLPSFPATIDLVSCVFVSRADSSTKTLTR